VRRALERLLVALAHRLERPAAWVLSRPPVRARVRRRTLRAWRAGDSPLILCYGNINRSAFAAGFAGAHGRASARSAGFYPRDGRRSPATTIACAARYGVDLTAHRSTRITRPELAGAQAIFVFDLENVARVAALDPLALPRTHLLGALDDDPRVLISDPHNRGLEVLERTVARIARAIERGEGAE
jgi:low molecular weight protein-tyrosine phosphatase